jgi:hypothetical protein
MGRGLVEPVDDFRVTNPPTNPALLNALADYQIRMKYDLREMARAILNSRSYQLSSAPTASNESDDLNYSRYYLKRQMAEVLFDAMGQASEARQKVPGAPPGERAISVALGSPNYFLTAFGKPGARDQICERNQDPDVAQAMHLINGDTLQRFITDKGNIVDRVLAQELWTDERRVNEIYLAALSRSPTSEEAAMFSSHLAKVEDANARKRVYQDLLWAILNSKEFAYIY